MTALQPDAELHELLEGAAYSNFESGIDQRSMAMRWTPPPVGYHGPTGPEVGPDDPRRSE